MLAMKQDRMQVVEQDKVQVVKQDRMQIVQQDRMQVVKQDENKMQAVKQDRMHQVATQDKMQVVKQEGGGSEDVLSVLTNSEAGSTQDPTTILTAGNKVLACPYKSSNQLSSRLIAKGAKSSMNFKSAASASNKAPSAGRLMVARKKRAKGSNMVARKRRARNSIKTNSTQMNSGRARTLRADKVKRTRAHARQRLEFEAKQATRKQAACHGSALRSGAVKRTTSRAHLHRKAAPSKQVLNIQRGSAAFGSAALFWVQQVQGPPRVFVLGLQQDAQHDAPALQKQSLAIDGQAETAEISSTSITSSEEDSAKTNSPNLRGSRIFRGIGQQVTSPNLGDDGSKVEMENDKGSKMSNYIKSPNLRGSAVFLQEVSACGKGSSSCGCAQDELESLQMLSTANPKEKTALRDLCKLEKGHLRKAWDSVTRRLGLGESACVKNLAVGAYVFRYNSVNWLTSYTPEAQVLDFHALPEEYTDIIQSKAGPVQWSHILDEYERLLALSKSSKSTRPVVKPLPSMYSARNGLGVVFSLGLTMRIPIEIQRLCEDVAQNGGNSAAPMMRPVLWLLRRSSSKSKSGATSTQLQEACRLLLPKVRDLIAEGAQTVAQKTAVLLFPTGVADSRRIHASLIDGALNDFNSGERGTAKVGQDDAATVMGLSKMETALQQDMKAQAPHLVQTAASEDGSSGSSSCCEHCGVAGVYDRLVRLLFQSGAGALYRGQAASSFITTQPGEEGERSQQAVSPVGWEKHAKSFIILFSLGVIVFAVWVLLMVEGAG
ncbi:unnamed protein product [Amoebophrya sp. A25]|nr:unnamed protein product [Amoebophrya sp. A25]|eukprot:GSA25T00006937001.1